MTLFYVSRVRGLKQVDNYLVKRKKTLLMLVKVLGHGRRHQNALESMNNQNRI